MGGYLDKPVVEKERKMENINGIHYALSSMQGYRPSQEDAHVTVGQIQQNGKFDKWSLFMVLDGHGGDFPAKYASEKILSEILEQNYFAHLKPEERLDVLRVEKAIQNAFNSLDHKIRDEFNKKPDSGAGGTTISGVLISEEYFIFINLGDSRTVLANKPAGRSKVQVKFSTVDQKPENEEETRRIRAAGGDVFAFQSIGPQRVDGELAVARALGDYQYKDKNVDNPNYWKVSNQPVVNCIKREADDSFCVIACDGIFDVVENNDLVQFIEYNLQRKTDVQETVDDILDTCLFRGSKDNMSAIVLSFEDATPTTINNNLRETDAKLLLELNECVSQELRERGTQIVDATVVLKNLPETKKFDLPGVGISGRYTDVGKMCEQYYSKGKQSKS